MLAKVDVGVVVHVLVDVVGFIVVRWNKFSLVISRCVTSGVKTVGVAKL